MIYLTYPTCIYIVAFLFLLALIPAIYYWRVAREVSSLDRYSDACKACADELSRERK